MCIYYLAEWFYCLAFLSAPWALNILNSVLRVYFPWLLILNYKVTYKRKFHRTPLRNSTLFYRSLCLFFEYKHPKFFSCKILVPFHQVPQCPGFFLGLLEAWYPHLLERNPARVWGWEPECLWFGAAQMINLSLPLPGQPSLATETNKRGYSGTQANREEKCYAMSKLPNRISYTFLPDAGSTHVPVEGLP